MDLRRLLLVLVGTAVLSLNAWAESAELIRPVGIPDLTDPEVQARFSALDVGRLDRDPDFPALLLKSITGEAPRFLVVVLDARNGKRTWSLQEDPAVFFLLMKDAETIQEAFLDEGFAAGGTPTGTFIAAGPESATDLVAQLRQSHIRILTLRAL